MSRVRLTVATDSPQETRSTPGPAARAPIGDTGRGKCRSAPQAAAEHRLALLGPLAAVGLGLAEEIGQLLVAVPLGVLDVGLQAQRVAEAGLRVPDQVVVLVPGARDAAGLGC